MQELCGARYPRYTQADLGAGNAAESRTTKHLSLEWPGGSSTNPTCRVVLTRAKRGRGYCGVGKTFTMGGCERAEMGLWRGWRLHADCVKHQSINLARTAGRFPAGLGGEERNGDAYVSAQKAPGYPINLFSRRSQPHQCFLHCQKILQSRIIYHLRFYDQEPCRKLSPMRWKSVPGVPRMAVIVLGCAQKYTRSGAAQGSLG